MAREEHLGLVLQGSEAIARWREKNPDATLDLSGANLRRADFVRANLSGAILTDANLEWADLRWADLVETDLSGVRLSRADLHKADLSGARLRKAILSDANLEDANCQRVDLHSAIFAHTRLLNTDLRGANGLSEAKHQDPSFIDTETLIKSDHLPREFLRGCGVSDMTIQAVYFDDSSSVSSSLEAEADYYSCFISYSSKDESFAERLCDDLQQRGVRCWYAPHDMRIGESILDTVFSEIRQREKLLLIFSEQSVASMWVRDEVERAFAEERDRGDFVVFPVRIDDTVFRSATAWSQKIRDTRHIGDFRNWHEETSYRRSLERLLHDLKPVPIGKGPRKRQVMVQSTREEVVRRSGGRCAICGRLTNELQIDHILPLMEGGSNSLDNLRAVCPSCNVAIHRQPTTVDDLIRQQEGGYRFERLVSDTLGRLGYALLTGATGSDAGVDLVARKVDPSTGKPISIVIQCKYSERPLSKAQVDEFGRKFEQYGANMGVVVTNQRVSASVRSAAERWRVKVLSMDELASVAANLMGQHDG